MEKAGADRINQHLFFIISVSSPRNPAQKQAALKTDCLFSYTVTEKNRKLRFSKRSRHASDQRKQHINHRWEH